MKNPPPPPEPNESVFWKCVHYLPQTVFVLVGFAYVTGFLTTFTFLERFGVREAGADVFKIKYIHVGILALFFPVGIVAPITLILSLRGESLARFRADIKTAPIFQGPASNLRFQNRLESTTKPTSEAMATLSVHLSNAILITNMMLGFYVLVLFAEPVFFQNHEFVLPSLFALTLVGVVIVNLFVKKYWMQQWSKWLLALVAIFLQLSWCTGLSGHLAAMFWGAPSALAHTQPLWIFQHWQWAATIRSWFVLRFPMAWNALQVARAYSPKGGVYYALFTCLCFLLARRTQTWARLQDSWQGKTKIYLMGFVMIAATYFLSVLSFAYRVFPYIPVAKGGGDYTNASRVTLQIKTEDISIVPKALFDDPETRNEPASLVLIEQTPDALYVARDDDAGGPPLWRTMEQLPDVIEIRRDEVVSINHSRK